MTKERKSKIYDEVQAVATCSYNVTNVCSESLMLDLVRIGEQYVENMPLFNMPKRNFELYALQ